MTVEEAVKLVVSGGIVTPPDRTQSTAPVMAKTNTNDKRIMKKVVSKMDVAKKTTAKKANAKTRRAVKQA